jgi:Methyltransferase domain
MPARYETIARWARENFWEHGAELGVADGRTLFYLLDNCPRLSLIGVDVWDPAHEEGATKSGERCGCPYCQETRTNRKKVTVEQMQAFVWQRRLLAGSRLQLYKMTTTRASRLLPNHCLDFVFIDADHSREAVSRDITHWRDKVRRGGRVIGHDYNMRSVRDAVHAMYHRGDVHSEDDHLWWVEAR